MLKNENGSFLMLEDGNLQRFETGKTDPATGGVRPLRFRYVEILQSRPATSRCGIRERYLWELMVPPVG